jgi:hypothetical protein
LGTVRRAHDHKPRDMLKLQRTHFNIIKGMIGEGYTALGIRGGGEHTNMSVEMSVTYELSGFRRGLVEVFALPRCFAA